MTSKNTDDRWMEIGTAVRDAGPEVPVFTDVESQSLWRQIEVEAASHASRRRVGWKALAAGAVAVVAFGSAGAAAAGVFSAHTGQGPVDAEDAELGGPGERLDPSAPDLISVLDEVTADVRFPSLTSREQALIWESNDLRGLAGPSVSTGAIRMWVAGHAICSWSDTWAFALRTGDTEMESQAADVILSARTWPAITDTDPDMANESEFAWLPKLEQAIKADSPAGAKRALQTNSACMPGLGPELGLGESQ